MANGIPEITAHRIEVATKSTLRDISGEATQQRIVEDLSLPVTAVRTIKVFTIEGELPYDQLELLGEELLADPIIQVFSVDNPIAQGFDWDFLIEVGYRSGVTDNEGRTATEAAKEILNTSLRPVSSLLKVYKSAAREILGVSSPPSLKVYTSTQYLLSGELNHEDAKRIAKELLANELIERFTIIKRQEWDGKIEPVIPKVQLQYKPQVEKISFRLDEEGLINLSQARLLNLSIEDMQVIRAYFEKEGRDPTDAELEALAQTWSEHCAHRIFKGIIEYREKGKVETIDSLFDTYIKGATEKIGKDWLISVFEDNAGIIQFDEEYNIVMKVETHNSPSALCPYGGALTGIVGVNRDPMGTGLGSRLVFNTDVFCFAYPDYQGELPQGVLHPKRVFEGVRRGVEHGANLSGIPTVNGAIRFDDRYLGVPLVFCGTGGIMSAEINGKPSHIKKIKPGDLVVMVGGRVGKDGIHGATFSSAGLDETSPASAVQIGSPFVQKKMSDFLLEARDLGLYTSVQDNGAGGLSSSVGELAPLSGGSEIELDKAPLKYTGLAPWEVLLSEAQERMTLSVPPNDIEGLLQLAKKHEVEATVIGNFTDSGRFIALYDGETVADLDLDFLLHGYPQKRLKAVWKPLKLKEPIFPQPKNLGEILHKLLGRLNICSRESIIRQYDHEVQAGMVGKPLVGANNDGPSDAAVLWPLEAMRKGNKRGMVISNGINHNYGDVDTYHMAANCVDEAIRNAVAVGANPDQIALLDNFAWSSSDDPFRLAQLVRACKALYDCAIVYGTPYISGKDSMFNQFESKLNGEIVKLAAPPTLLISALGIIEDIEKAVTMDLKAPGNLIYLLGETRMELGGSEYYALMGEELQGERFIGKSVPQVQPHQAIKLYRALHRAILAGLLEATHDLSEGGLAIAAAEMAIAGGLGMELDLTKVLGVYPLEDADLILFSESPSRLLVEVRPENRARFEKIMSGCKISKIGWVGDGEDLVINGRDTKPIILDEIAQFKESWQRPLVKFYT